MKKHPAMQGVFSCPQLVLVSTQTLKNNGCNNCTHFEYHSLIR